MPEGDSLHRLAAELAPKLVGATLRSLDLVRSGARTEGLRGSKIVGVEARGKNLLVHFATDMIEPAAKPPGAVASLCEDASQAPGSGEALTEIALADAPASAPDPRASESSEGSAERPAASAGRFSFHVHLKMNGRVRIYARSSAPPVARFSASAVLETDSHRVVIYGAPVARLLRTRDVRRDVHFRGLGPDLLGPTFDLDEACARLRARGATPLGEALMDQSVVAGIGNVWKSELCFTLRLDPFAPVSRVGDAEISALVSLARTQMFDTVYGPVRTRPDPFEPRAQRKARLDRRQGEGVLSVYGRLDQPCYDCGTPIAMRRQGELLRSTYYCPQCQPTRGET